MKKLKVSSSDDHASVNEPVDQGVGDSSSLQTLKNSKIEKVIDKIQPLRISLRRLPASLRKYLYEEYFKYQRLKF